MSKVCITIPEECKSCYKLCVEYCPTGINIQAGLVDGTMYYLFVVDHFGNVWRDEIFINPDGSFDIDLGNYPSGFFTSTSGAVNVFLSATDDGANPIDITFETGTYNCILISTQPQVDFVNEDVTIFNPGSSNCGVTPGWTVVWGNIEGEITNQTDLIDYIATLLLDYVPTVTTITINGVTYDLSEDRTWNITSGLTCDDLPDCQTIIDILNTISSIEGDISNIYSLLATKFDIPTGTASDYLDGTGTPTPFPSIPAQYNPSAGTGISITGSYPNQTITNTDPDQIVVLTGGTAILITGTYPNFTIDNLSPDQIVSLNNGTGISVTGTYPNFTIDNTLPDQVVVLSNGSGISITGSYPNFTITNSSPDQVVGLTASTGISITGTYPNFTITNTSPDQVLNLTAGTGITISGTYPNFTITNSQSLSGYVPYTGATQNVDLGVYKLTADAIEFDLNPVNAAGAGQIVYNGATGALNYLLNSSNVASQIGETIHALVYNAEGIQINKGQAVYLYQATGNKASVKLAYNTSDSTSAKTFGLAAENIGAGQNGFVICQGVLDGLNLGTYTDGDTLYLGSTPGSYTSIKPYAPNHLVYIGIVERANNGNGQIYVKTQNGYELDEIHDVDLITTPPVNNDVLTYVTGSPDLWKPRSISTILGYTPLANNNWVDYSTISTITGWSSFTTKELKYKIIGDTMFVKFYLNGTSNSTISTFTLPNVSGNTYTENNCRTVNNSTNQNGFCFLFSTSNLVVGYYWTAANAWSNTWTASGGKLLSGELFFEIGTTTLDFDAQNFISWAGITDATQKSAINQLVLDLKAYNLWNKCTCIYPWVGGTATAHSLNLKNPALFPLTFTAGWTHTNLGGTPTNAYANPVFTPSTFLTVNNTHLSFYMGTDTAAGNKIEMGVGVGGSLVPFMGLFAKYTGNLAYSNAYNISNNQISAANTDRRGHYIGSRTSSTLHKLYKNGSVIATDTNATINPLPSLGIVIGCLNSNGTFTQYTDGQFRFTSIGQGLNDTEALNFRTAVQAFQTTLGRQV